MRLLALTPAHVGTEEIERRQTRYDRFTDGRLVVSVHDQPDRPDVPHTFDTAALVAAADRCVVERAGELRLGDEDVVMPDCVLDTALEELTASGLPVQGLMRITVNVLSGLGLPFGAVARNHAVGDALDARLRTYDTAGLYVGTKILDLPSSAVADTQVWNAALAERVGELAARGARAVINGCSAVDVTAGPFAAVVVDPTELAVRTLAMAGELGLITAPRADSADYAGASR